MSSGSKNKGKTSKSKQVKEQQQQQQQQHSSSKDSDSESSNSSKTESHFHLPNNSTKIYSSEFNNLTAKDKSKLELCNPELNPLNCPSEFGKLRERIYKLEGLPSLSRTQRNKLKKFKNQMQNHIENKTVPSVKMDLVSSPESSNSMTQTDNTSVNRTRRNSDSTDSTTISSYSAKDQVKKPDSKKNKKTELGLQSEAKFNKKQKHSNKVIVESDSEAREANLMVDTDMECTQENEEQTSPQAKSNTKPSRGKSSPEGKSSSNTRSSSRAKSSSGGKSSSSTRSSSRKGSETSKPSSSSKSKSPGPKEEATDPKDLQSSRGKEDAQDDKISNQQTYMEDEISAGTDVESETVENSEFSSNVSRSPEKKKYNKWQYTMEQYNTMSNEGKTHYIKFYFLWNRSDQLK